MSVDSTLLNQSAGPSSLSMMSIQSKQESDASFTFDLKNEEKEGERDRGEEKASSGKGDEEKDKRIEGLERQVKDLKK